MDDEFKSLRSFCARTGVEMPLAENMVVRTAQVLPVLDMLAKHLEALEEIVARGKAV